MSRMPFAKRAIAAIYSNTAGKLYEPIVVQGAFKVFGGSLHNLVADQGRRAVALADGGPILDMPVGTGYFTAEVARAHPGVVIGADIAGGMVIETQRKARAEGIENLVAVQCDVHALPFADDSFPAILCSNGLQVMPGLHRAIAELYRVLAPDGSMFVSVVMLPVGALLPDAASDHLPTMLRSRAYIARTLTEAGFEIGLVESDRLAYMVEARKPPL